MAPLELRMVIKYLGGLISYGDNGHSKEVFASSAEVCQIA